MRLTLRTLLAYLDDVLDPANSKEIGHKIQESPVALKTIERIREVTRRRRINSPALTDAKLDPNETSEYLDNTLDPSKVAGIEQICLDDDEYLAEVAACHQILTLVLGEPVEVSSNTRERMYQLEHQQKNYPHSASTNPVFQSQLTPERQVAPVTKSPEKQDAEYLKRDSFLQKYWPITLILALGLGWLYVFMTDETFIKNNPSITQNNPNTPQGNLNQKPPVIANPGIQDQSSGTSSTGTGMLASGQQTNPAINQPVATNITDSSSGTMNSGNVSTNTLVSANPLMPANTTPSIVNNNPADVPPPNAAATVNTTPIPPLFYRYNDDLLIHQRIMDDDWYAVEHEQQVFINELLACPKPFRAVLEFPHIKTKVELDGGSVVQFHPPTPEREFGLEIKRGRVIISRLAEDMNSPLKLELIVGKHTWPVNISPGKFLLGFDVTPRLPEHFEESFGGLTHQVNVKSDQGKVVIKLEDNTMQTLDGPQEFALTTLKMNIPRLRDLNHKALATLQNTDWLKENDQLKSTSQKKQAKEFLKEVDVGPEDAPLPVWLSITPLITEPNVKNADFATQTLALKCFKKGDHAEELIMCIARTPHEEVMKSAIDGLREWLASDPENRKSFREDLTKVFSQETSEILYQLFWGYSHEDLKNLETSLKLVDLLLHNDECVRHLAFYHIERITGVKNNYHPLEDPDRRESTVRRWRQQIEQNGGLVR